MREDGPHIEIDHSDNADGAQAVATRYDMDKGPLAMPEHIKIGAKSWDGHKLESYGDQVDEYGVWLEEQVKADSYAVMRALDDIYNKAIKTGVILTTRCVPSPYITHAHQVKRFIMELAS